MLDIYDINYEYCSEKLGILNLPPANLPRKGILFRILSQIKGAVKHGLKRKNGVKINKGTILFFCVSQNELKSVSPILLNIPGSVVFGVDNIKNGFPLGRIYFFSLFFIPVVFFRFLFCKNSYHRRSFLYAFDGFCISYASKYILPNYLRKLSPSKIVIANQLSFYHRSLAYAAKDLEIETIYIQHASVTPQFSNLNMFSAALLEGEDSLCKYQANGTIGLDLYLIGMPKFDEYYTRLKKNDKILSVGVCTNGMDDFDSFSTLIDFLCRNIPGIKVYIRPHPADRRKTDWFSLAEKFNCLFSDVSDVESFKFFEQVDLIIAGDSNIHLEAVLLNLHSIYFDPLRAEIDWYGFSANGLVEYAVNTEGVQKYITQFSKNISDPRKRAKYYVDTINTDFDGKSSILASMIIQNNLSNELFKVDDDVNGNKVYRLK